MVHYSAPARILFTGEVERIGHDGSRSCRTSPTRSKTTVDDNDDQETEQNWSGSFHAFAHQSHHRQPQRVVDRETPKVKIPITVLSPLVDPRYQEESSHLDFQQDEKDEGTACHKHCLASVARLAPRGKVNTRARIERLQHQLGKPIRAVSAGKRIVTQSCVLDCFTDKDPIEMRARAEAKQKGDSTHKTISWQSQQQPNDKGLTMDAKELGNRCTEDGWVDFDDSGVKEFRWLYSCNLWPSNKSSSVDPPGHYYKTVQAVQFHFYNDLSVDISSEKGLATPETTSIFSANPTAELSDEESAVVLQEDLD